MRISTTTLIRGVLILAVALVLVPQSAFAQLPIETRQLKLQGATSGSLILQMPTTGNNYTVTYPSTQGSVGSFLFLVSTDGQLAWSTAAGGDNYVPVWNTTLNGGAGGIEWVDPAGADNPNWALGGNNLTAGSSGIFGTKTGAGIDIRTNNTSRMTIASDGAIDISTSGSTKVSIGNTGNELEVNAGTFDVNATTATIDGTTTITGVTGINTSGSAATTIGNTGASVTVTTGTGTITAATSLGITGTTNINTSGTAITTLGNTAGGTNIVGELQMNGTEGTDGQVLVSKGNQATPEWQSVGSAIGIRKAGKASISAATSVTVTGITTITADDAIIVTLQGSGSTVVPTVTAVTAGTGFTVTLSASYTGTLHYMVIRAQ